MPPTVIPVVQTWGTKQHLRYAVADTTGRFWTGSAWATRQRDALLYGSHHDAAATAHRILWKQFQRRHTVYQQFVVPLEMQVFANAEVDRSPTGTGVSARLALHYARGELQQGERITIESILGRASVFGGEVVASTTIGQYPAVVPEVSGTAFITGRHDFILDARDELGAGFLV